MISQKQDKDDTDEHKSLQEYSIVSKEHLAVLENT